MAQFARPDSDVSTGSWTAEGDTAETTLWESLDEAGAANDTTDYIESVGADHTCEVGLSNVTDPGGNTGYFIRFTMNGTGSGGPERCNVQLFEGATQRAETGIQTSRAAWAEKSYELTTAEADLINAFTDLRLKILSTNLVGGETVWVTQAFFETPDFTGGVSIPIAAYHQNHHNFG